MAHCLILLRIYRKIGTLPSLSVLQEAITLIYMPKIKRGQDHAVGASTAILQKIRYAAEFRRLLALAGTFFGICLRLRKDYSRLIYFEI